MFRRDSGICLMLVVVSLIATGAVVATPDIMYKTTSKVQFAGALGRAMNFAARLGGGSTDVDGTLHLKGNKLLQTDGDQATLIDLDGERMVTLNHKKKTYTSISFAEFGRQMDEMRAQMEEAAAEASADAEEEVEQTDAEEPTTEFKFDFQVNPTGEKAEVNGHDAERFWMTILMEAVSTEEPQDGEQPEEQGTLVIASDVWLTQELKGYEELQEFYKRYAEKFGEEVLGEAEMQNLSGVLQQAFTGDPRMQEGMERMAAETAKMKVVDVKNVTHVVLVAPAEEFNPELVFKAEPKPEKKKRGLGGFAKKLAKQAMGAENAESEEAREAQTQQTLLSMTTEMQEYSTESLPASMFEIPADYREVAFEDQ